MGRSAGRARASRFVGVVVTAAVLAVIAVGATTLAVLAADPASPDGVLLDVAPLAFAFVVTMLCGALLVVRRPSQTVGWVLLVSGGLPLLVAPLERYAASLLDRGETLPSAASLALWANNWYWIVMLVLLLVVLPCTFPTGRPLSRRWGLALLVPLAGALVAVVLGMFAPALATQTGGHVVANPVLGITWLPDAEDSVAATVAFLALEFGVLLGLASMVVRFRRSVGVERAQLKWFLFATAALPLIVVSDALERAGVTLMDDVVFAAVIVGLPVAITLAVLRYRLYDIDRLVSRSVSYGLVTLTLVAAYAGLTIGSQTLLGSGETPDVVVAGSTLVVAALFRPLQRRVRSRVDRRFDRSRYDAVLVTASFGQRVRDEVDLADLAEDLRRTVGEAVNPVQVTLWLPTDGASS